MFLVKTVHTAVDQSLFSLMTLLMVMARENEDHDGFITFVPINSIRDAPSLLIDPISTSSSGATEPHTRL
uniref:Putative secreted peptide n=1 Tax=Anopheles braziliensis TaxID=58242 RepID=A0A2M3ZSB9_9DIPT